MRLTLTVALGAVLATLLPSPAARAQCELAKLTAPDGATTAGWGFGRHAALAGDVAVVAAPWYDTNRGAVYVFRGGGTRWEFETKLTASDARDGDLFGWSLAFDGGTALISALDADGQVPKSGAVYVFSFDGTAWTEEQKLFPDVVTGKFGHALALDGDRALVGDRVQTAYVLERTRSGWVIDALLEDPALTGCYHTAFGSYVGLLGDVAVVAAPEATVNGLCEVGVVAVFERQGTAWVETAVIEPAEPSVANLFARSIAVLDDQILLGAPFVEGGAIWAYERSGSTWALAETITSARAWLGNPMTAADGPAGDLLLINVLAGSVLFERSAGLWNELALFPHATAGESRAIDGAQALLGSSLDDQLGPDKGAVWVFNAAIPRTYCDGKVSSQGCIPRMTLSGNPGLTDPNPFEVRASRAPGQKPGLCFYGLWGRAALPFWGGTLCVAPPLRRMALQTSGGNPPPDDCSGVYVFDFNAWAQGGGDPALAAGAVVRAQYWFRDPDNSDGTGVGLSDAAEFGLCN